MKKLIKVALLITFNLHNYCIFSSDRDRVHKLELTGPFYLCEQCCVITHSNCCKTSPLICPACRDPKMQYSETLFFDKNNKEECSVCLDRYVPSPELLATPASLYVPSAPPVSPSSLASFDELVSHATIPVAPPLLLKPKEYYRVHQQLLEEAKRAEDEKRRSVLAFAQNLSIKQFRHPKKDKK